MKILPYNDYFPRAYKARTGPACRCPLCEAGVPLMKSILVRDLNTGARHTVSLPAAAADDLLRKMEEARSDPANAGKTFIVTRVGGELTVAPTDSGREEGGQ